MVANKPDRSKVTVVTTPPLVVFSGIVTQSQLEAIRNGISEAQPTVQPATEQGA